VRVVSIPSSVTRDETAAQQFLSCYLVNRTVALDAGSLGFYRTPREQGRVKHVFLTHSHMDHVASLPIFVENTYRGDGDCATIYGSEATLDSVRRDLFNDRVWPDMLRISETRPPYLRLQAIEAGQTVVCEGLRLTPVPVDHVVPTFGYIVEDDAAAVVFPADTGPTEAIWDRANQCPNVQAVFLEVTFPNDMAWLADLAKHLTPELFAMEARKLKQPARVIAVHLSARVRRQVVKELRALDLPNLEIVRLGKAYQF
jgi:ribonuclease BN (tRNA processing enzyme)